MLPLIFGVTAIIAVMKVSEAKAKSNAVDYGVQFGPVYMPQKQGRYITLEQLRSIVHSVNNASTPYTDDTLLSIAKVESGDIHDPRAVFDTKAYRYEAHLNEASYGVFQMLASTARDMGLKGRPEQLYDPRLATEYAIKYLVWIDTYLKSKLNRSPNIREILYAYNGGVGTFLRSRNGTPATRQYVQKYDTALNTIRSA